MNISEANAVNHLISYVLKPETVEPEVVKDATIFLADIPMLHDELKWLREKAEAAPAERFDPYHDTDGKVELPPGVSVNFRNIVIDFSHSLNIMPSLTSTGYVITCNDCEGYRKEVARL